MAQKDVELTKNTLRTIFEEVSGGSRKLTFVGPDNIRPDSRYQILEIALDHVVFKLLSDERYIIPFAAMTSVKVGAKQLTITYR